MVLQEKALFELADLYKISVPVIYAPMFRRYIYIECSNNIFFDEIGLENIKLNFDNYQNLKDKIILNCRSVWNVSVELISPQEQIRYDNKTILKYSCDANQYIKFDEVSSDYFYEKESGRVTIKDKSNKNSNIAKIITINTENLCNGKIKPGYLFEEEFVANDDKIERIYSEGDIEKILSQFDKLRSNGLKFDGICFDKDARQVHYKKHFEYKIQNPIYCQKGATISLYFANSNDKFGTDYVIYVINYLRRNYPEYSWKGVIRL